MATNRDVDDPAIIQGALYGDGILGLKAAFTPQWADELGEDIERLFRDALARPGGAVGRGPNRYYVEIHPETIRGFVELATHPWVKAVCAATLGARYQVVEIGFDIPGPGAADQPWHRDFPAPPETTEERPPADLARVQPDHSGRDAGYGTVRDRAGNAVGRRGAVRAWDVSAARLVGAIRGAGRT